MALTVRWDRARVFASRTIAPNVYFRWATPADADREYLSWLYDPEVRRWLSFPSHRLTDLRAYIRSQVNNRRVAFFIIHDRSHSWIRPKRDQRIGTLKLVNEGHGRATVGIILGRSRGRGYGVEAIRLACHFALTEWDIRQVECGIDAANERSIKAFTRAGFTIRPKTMWGTCVS